MRARNAVTGERDSWKGKNSVRYIGDRHTRRLRCPHDRIHDATRMPLARYLCELC